MKKLSYFLSLVLLTAAIAVAQTENPGPPDKGVREHKMGMMGMGGMPGMPALGHDWWRNSEIAQAINLTDPQKQQLNQIFANHRTKLIQARGDVEIEEGKLSDLLEQDQPDQGAVLQQLSILQQKRNAMENEFTVMSLAFRGVLQPDQWKKLQAVTKERMQKMFFKHHEGEPGPMPPPPQ
ncbi:MAG: hypothetical protein DMG64_08665 [Acidobacteria bacterium]|nr:MAG: hypothetical protein DMG63_11840 [Acidobacteriota bacterium]PYY03218.1 MAG: hypothetical protein DMG64_08665 [Acidobacteriota bacterium]PYY23358.1 MAG: hypothetical protein DMG62_08265 [Acidobacteriota bacterium]